jgi:hypothetical protein
MNWQELAAFSHYKTATAVLEALRSGELEEATTGMEELIDAMTRSDRRALQSQLVRLMKHILKWQVQPGFRSRSWQRTIRQARRAIAEIQEDTPSLTDEVIRRLWDRTLREAHEDAQEETGLEFPCPALTWQDVFETTYDVDH